MTYARAILICEDVRAEANGSLTLIGVMAERLIVPRGTGPIAFARFGCVIIIGGLTGANGVAYRQFVRRVTDPVPTTPLSLERHEPTSDEHNFVMTGSPMVFPEAGAYEIGLDLEAAGSSASYRYPFRIDRAP